MILLLQVAINCNYTLGKKLGTNSKTFLGKFALNSRFLTKTIAIPMQLKRESFMILAHVVPLALIESDISTRKDHKL